MNRSVSDLSNDPSASTGTAGEGTEPEALRIGQLAFLAGVTTRTLRYWEEIGLVAPSARQPNQERVFSKDDLERVVRICDLQDLLGFSLAEIRTVLDADAVVDRLRRAYRKGAETGRRKRLLEEAIAANDRLIARLDDTITRIEEFRRERVAKGERMRAKAEELDAETVMA